MRFGLDGIELRAPPSGSGDGAGPELDARAGAGRKCRKIEVWPNGWRDAPRAHELGRGRAARDDSLGRVAGSRRGKSTREGSTTRLTRTVELFSLAPVGCHFSILIRLRWIRSRSRARVAGDGGFRRVARRRVPRTRAVTAAGPSRLRHFRQAALISLTRGASARTMASKSTRSLRACSRFSSDRARATSSRAWADWTAICR